MINAYDLKRIIDERDIITFAEEVLGIPLHPGQKHWLQYSWKPVNILKPANQWGKTTAEAICHIFQATTKTMLQRFNMSHEDWMRFRYITLNFGKTYEIAKGVMEAIVDITEGKYLLPNGGYNKSLLRGWAIDRVINIGGAKLPEIMWWNHSETLIRSYDQLGESFKRLRLAFVSGDECGDIPELKLFLTGTLMPRCFYFQAPIHLVGTSQPKGLEYEEISEEAEESFLKDGLDSDYFVVSYHVDPDMSSVYTNEFMPKDHIKKIESIADPELKKQIIQGQYVDWTEHLYTWDEVHQMFSEPMPYDKETGLSETPEANAYYAFSVDMAATEDETSITCLRFNLKTRMGEDKWAELPHRVVFHKAWKGKTMTLSVQYELIKQYFSWFKRVSPNRTYFIYDAGALGGKNAGDAFRDLNGYPFPPKGRSYAEVKAEGMGKVKEVLGRGRSSYIDESGKIIDRNASWGGVRASPKLFELRRQLEIASQKDDRIKNDQFTSFMQGLHFIEMRKPKLTHTRAMVFNLMR